MGKPNQPSRQRPKPGALSVSYEGITKPRRPTTRSVTKPMRDAEIKAQKQKLIAAARAVEARRAEALKNMPKAPPGNRGDGRFHIAFVRMGQGDCTVISTPAGRTVLIDCGSDATEVPDAELYTYHKTIRDTLYGPKFLQGTTDLDILILTHPDTDHYNKLKKVLNGNTKIGKVYHSSNRGGYSADQVSTWLCQHVGTALENINILEVTLNETGAHRLGNSTVAGNLNGDPPCLDDRGAIRILKEKDCVISFLAGNVTANVGDNSNPSNRGSLVTLIETFGKKILICGDATRSTDAFILQRYQRSLPGLRGVDLMHIPHHGSNVTSSSDLLVQALQPKQCVISAGKKVLKDHLPSQTVIERYWAFQEDGKVPDHELFFWTPGALGSFFHQSKFTKKNLYVTGSNNTIEVTYP
jgi:beta-lactamase superfamily II metal-dependent hydrolase